MDYVRVLWENVTKRWVPRLECSVYQQIASSTQGIGRSTVACLPQVTCSPTEWAATRSLAQKVCRSAELK